jgi:hypothetical protein
MWLRIDLLTIDAAVTAYVTGMHQVAAIKVQYKSVYVTMMRTEIK